MRSDWDEQFGKRPDLQKRYPDITLIEWEVLRELVEIEYESGVGVLPEARLHFLALLIAKINKRIGET